MAGGLRKGSISDGTKKVRSSIEMEVLSVHGKSHRKRLEEESVRLQFGVGGWLLLSGLRRNLPD